MIIKKINNDKTMKFDSLRKEAINSIKNFSSLNELPKYSESNLDISNSTFLSEKIVIRELDYYFSNAISRSSKTMSECRQARQKIKKTGTNS